MLEALTVALNVLLDSAPLGFSVRTGLWGCTVTSALISHWEKWVVVPWQVSPERQCEGSVEAYLALLPPQQSWQSAEGALMPLSIAVPIVTSAGCLLRAVLHPSPALGHTKITCISIVTTLYHQWTCEGGMSSFPPRTELGGAGRSSVPGAAVRTCHELLHLLGTVGLIFGNWPSTRATKQGAA